MTIKLYSTRNKTKDTNVLKSEFQRFFNFNFEEHVKKIDFQFKEHTIKLHLKFEEQFQQLEKKVENYDKRVNYLEKLIKEREERINEIEDDMISSNANIAREIVELKSDTYKIIDVLDQDIENSKFPCCLS